MVKNSLFSIGNPSTGFFSPKTSQNGHFRTLGPVSLVMAKKRKIGQNRTFWCWNVLKLGQNVVCSYFVDWKLSNQKKESGNTVFWFFPFFWSVVNLAGMVPPKSQFRTRFRKFDANPEDWDHKKAMLNGGTHLKVAERLFWGKKISFCSIWLQMPNKDHFFHWKILKFHNLESDYEKRHFLGPTEAILALFWPLFGQFWLKGPIQNNFFYWISYRPPELGVKDRL